MAKELILKTENISKSFGPTHANKNVNFELYGGEIRGLAGANGSGKSTLVSIISGIYSKDSGTMYKNGRLYEPKSPIDANRNKVGIVVQELGMVESLPIVLNMFLGRVNDFKKNGIITMNRLYSVAEEVLEKWGLSQVPLYDLAGSHTIETRKIAEIGRALSLEPDILVLDEVTQSLSNDNRKIVYNVINKCREMGKAILVISHDLNELLSITDTITVMRDGEVVDTVDSRETSLDTLKELMIGSSFENAKRNTAVTEKTGETVLEVSGLSAGNILKDISFDLHKGEILSFCGLSDSGIHELGLALTGSMKRDAGKVVLKKNNVDIDTPVKAKNNRISYLPKDRDQDAMMLHASLTTNICLPNIEEIKGKLGFISFNKLRGITKQAIKDYDVKCLGPAQEAGHLSGGNKQKINLARWMIRDTDVFILDSPTRGVDVGIKAYIYKLLFEIQKKGTPIIVITDEQDEAILLSSRIVVMKDGEIKKIVSSDESYTEKELVEVML